MKVYAEFSVEKGIEYRQQTLLQIGDSWDLIGSAVLKNPGSASPKSQVTDDTFENIKRLVGKDCKAKDTWYDFSSDSTMRFLKKIFNGNYAHGESTEINGVIQLFNLYYIRDKDIAFASSKLYKNKSRFVYPNCDELVSSFQNKPVYLGWRDECYRNEETLELAKKIFTYVAESEHMYLEEIFENNEFNHPMGIHLWLSRKSKLKIPLIKFHSKLKELT